MIQHDAVFETLAQAPVKQTDVEVVKQISDPYGYYDDTPYWTSSDVLMSVDISANGTFLSVATKKAVVKLLGIVETASVGDLFQIRLGLYNNDPSVSGFNYISQGFYFVDDIKFDYEAGSTTVTMYDHMWLAKDTYYADPTVAASFEYPVSVQVVAQSAASAINTELMEGFEKLPNASYNIESDPYVNINNATIRDIIQEIAATTGTTAIIRDTTLVFKEYLLNRKAT